MPEIKFQPGPLDLETKGIGAAPAGMAIDAVGQLGWSVLAEDVSLPVAVLRDARIEHNLQWMQTFIERYGVSLAPHGKTTMSPALFRRQIEHGAWGITLATAPQVNAAYRHGVRRVLMANQLVGRGNMAIIADLQRDDTFSFCCCVDSADNVDALGRFFAERGQRLRVLLEYGVAGGRTGVRDEAQELAVREEIARWPQSLSLVGVEVYEGVLKEEAAIRTFLRKVVARTTTIAAAGEFAEPRVLLSGAGSAWFDVVAEEFAGQDVGMPLDVVLRPGCYLTHDVGIYREAETRIQAENPVAREIGRSLLPALQVWANVQSLPEPGRAIIALGKRDAAFDAGLPIPSLHYRPGDAAPVAAPETWAVTAMMDQHAFMSIPHDAPLRVGDMIAFDISHPCLTFDKWRQLLTVDEAYRVTGAVATFF
ncbi:amino acid deaminase [Chitinasiproducens palmae]|uniref:D-serine dehydratase n=1 Tax=Chitinasiproducens palmae TaxID=1770053 RepID=A0A1H2PJJ5_9BURK|nr:amino acid deaminase [Chitinasiproducens palmae]SDV46568.1 D-serine dehydratase [Chitinasiproducens palmae]